MYLTFGFFACEFFSVGCAPPWGAEFSCDRSGPPPNRSRALTNQRPTARRGAAGRAVAPLAPGDEGRLPAKQM